MSRGHFAAALAAAVFILAAPAAAQANSFPLVGWWPMNDGKGQTVKDWSGRGNNGVLGASSAVEATDPSWIKGVFLGSALRFDGVDDVVTIPDSSALEPSRITVAAWVRNTGSPGTFKYIVAKAAADCDHSSYGLYTGPDGGLAFYIADGSQFYRSPQMSQNVWDGQWHHVAGTFDGDTVRLYVDGNQVGSGTPAATSIDYANPVGGGTIGAFPDSTCWHGPLTLQGDIDGVQIWSQALPVDSIWRVLRSLFSLSR